MKGSMGCVRMSSGESVWQQILEKMAADYRWAAEQIDEREKEIERRDAELMKGMCIAPFPFTITRMK
jgi:hypothetical protein